MPVAGSLHFEYFSILSVKQAIQSGRTNKFTKERERKKCGKDEPLFRVAVYAHVALCPNPSPNLVWQCAQIRFCSQYFYSNVQHYRVLYFNVFGPSGIVYDKERMIRDIVCSINRTVSIFHRIPALFQASSCVF